MQTDASQPVAALRVAQAVRDLNRRYWHFTVIAMLVLLHVATVRGVADVWARAFMLAHLGLLLLWQPFLRSEQSVNWGQTAVIAGLATVVMLRLEWWMLAFWVVVLAGLVGGKVTQHHARWQRRVYLVVLLYLLALLTVIVLPEVAPRKEITPEVREIAEWTLPLLLAATAFFPVEAERVESPQLIDFFYSLFLMLLLGVAVLGSFTFMTLRLIPYLEALTYTVFTIAASVMLIGLAWSPRSGFAGLDVFVSRYLLSIGLPLERWLFFLAGLSQAQSRPERFLSEAVVGLVGLPWVSGASWQSARGSGENGTITAHSVEYADDALTLRIFAHYRLSPALRWHLLLLGQVLGEFYQGKLREEHLRHSAYLEAVHETGARMTHEVKNLLQSLQVLTSVTQKQGADAERLPAFVQRELPRIAERLARTLDRLRRPHLEEERFIPIGDWWMDARSRYRRPGVEFADQLPIRSARQEEGLSIPGALFDAVLDNLLQNALAKRQADPGVVIRVTLNVGEAPELHVEDTGAAVPPDVAAALFREPVRSEGGMGIGLYQVSRLAESRGYRLRLAHNATGSVQFVLSPGDWGAARARPDSQGNTPAATIRP